MACSSPRTGSSTIGVERTCADVKRSDDQTREHLREAGEINLHQAEKISAVEENGTGVSGDVAAATGFDLLRRILLRKQTVGEFDITKKEFRNISP